jgi:hypothetical protein
MFGKTLAKTKIDAKTSAIKIIFGKTYFEKLLNNFLAEIFAKGNFANFVKFAHFA